MIELAPNTGPNLMALHQLFPNAELTGVEINDIACEKLLELGYVNVHHCSFNDFSIDKTWDLVLIKSTMIYQPDELLPDLYSRMYRLTHRYIFICEYYSPYPVNVPYRGESFCKRDFAGEMMDMYPALKLADYGFVYHRDYNFPLDDHNWFLLEKCE